MWKQMINEGIDFYFVDVKIFIFMIVWQPVP